MSVRRQWRQDVSGQWSSPSFARVSFRTPYIVTRGGITPPCCSAYATRALRDKRVAATHAAQTSIICGVVYHHFSHAVLAFLICEHGGTHCGRVRAALRAAPMRLPLRISSCVALRGALHSINFPLLRVAWRRVFNARCSFAGTVCVRSPRPRLSRIAPPCLFRGALARLPGAPTLRRVRAAFTSRVRIFAHFTPGPFHTPRSAPPSAHAHFDALQHRAPLSRGVTRRARVYRCNAWLHHADTTAPYIALRQFHGGSCRSGAYLAFCCNTLFVTARGDDAHAARPPARHAAA